jgi:hypothetical protein
MNAPARLLLILAALMLCALPLWAASAPPAPPPASAPPAATPDAATAPAPVDCLVGMFMQGTAEQFGRLSELIETQYPTLSDELVNFLFQQQPDLLTQLMPSLAPVLAQSYPEVGTIIGQVIHDNDQLKLRVSQMVDQNYPTFEADVRAIPTGPQRHQQVALLISLKYPTLQGQVVDLLRTEFPDVLNQVRQQVEAKYPDLLRTMAQLTAKHFPHLAAQVLGYVVNHYPKLLPQLLEILNNAPPPPAAAAPSASATPPAASSTVSPPKS